MICRSLIESPELAGVEVRIDIQGARADSLLPLLRTIQQSGQSSLICSGLDPDGIERLASAGLAHRPGFFRFDSESPPLRELFFLIPLENHHVDPQPQKRFALECA